MKNSIIEIALSSKFTAEQMPSIMKIIHATPNPDVAVETLLGIYKLPEIPAVPGNLERFQSNVRNITFKSFDKFTGMVSYTCNHMKTKSGWIENVTDTIVENIINASRYVDDAAASLKMSHDEFRKNYTYHTFDDTLELDSKGKVYVYDCVTELSIWLDEKYKK